MNEMDELPPDDPLLALLDTYTVAGSDIENRVMAQLEREEEQVALRAEVAGLRDDIAAMRAEMREIKRLLLTRAEHPPISAPQRITDDTRGKPLLPFARRTESPSLIS